LGHLAVLKRLKNPPAYFAASLEGLLLTNDFTEKKRKKVPREKSLSQKRKVSQITPQSYMYFAHAFV